MFSLNNFICSSLANSEMCTTHLKAPQTLHKVNMFNTEMSTFPPQYKTHTRLLVHISSQAEKLHHLLHCSSPKPTFFFIINFIRQFHRHWDFLYSPPQVPSPCQLHIIIICPVLSTHLTAFNSKYLSYLDYFNSNSLQLVSLSAAFLHPFQPPHHPFPNLSFPVT